MLVCTSMPKIHFCLNFLKLCSLVENGRPPDPADWAVTDVVNYFRTVGFEEQANAFQEQVNLFAQSFLLLISSLGDFRVGTIIRIFLALQNLLLITLGHLGPVVLRPMYTTGLL